jgi:CheY-like chemotaxis protein
MNRIAYRVLAKQAPRTQRRVLIVDDEPTVVRTLSKLICAEGHQVLTAESYTQALENILEQTPDLVLIDYLWKGQENGLELAQQLMRIRPETPFIIVSGQLTTAVTVAAVKLGAQNVLEKPIARDTLCSAMQSALNAPRRQRPVWADLGSVMSITDRVAVLVGRATSSETDPTTHEALAHHVGVSVGSFREWCRLMRLTAHDVRDLARMLRVVVRSAGNHRRMPNLLDARDPRTRNNLLARAGLSNLTDSTMVTAESFLRSQTFVPEEHDLVRTLIRLLERS